MQRLILLEIQRLLFLLGFLFCVLCFFVLCLSCVFLLPELALFSRSSFPLLLLTSDFPCTSLPPVSSDPRL